MILEELIEAAESGSDRELIKFALTMKKSAIKIISSLEENGRGRKDGDLLELRDACADLRVVMGNLIHLAGVNDKFDDDFKEVMNSNFSKFCSTEEQAQDSVKAYANGIHPNKIGNIIDCYYEKVGDYWIVKRKNDNKILKSIEFVEPNFK